MDSNYIIDNKIDVAGLRKVLFGLEVKDRMKFLFVLGMDYIEMKRRKFEILIDERDYMVYSVVKIGNQYWLGENMSYNVDGSVLNPDFPSHDYGRLYNYEQSIKALPEGWHLPSDQEWNELEMHYGTEAEEVTTPGERGTAAYKLSSPEWMGKGESLFNALPTGYHMTWKTGSEFAALGTQASFFSATGSDSKNAWCRHWGGVMGMVGRYDVPRDSVYRGCRGIKNSD